MKTIRIDPKNANQRIDKYVRKLLNDAPLSFIYKLFRKKDVKVNGHWVKENYILNENDVLSIFVTDEQLADFSKPISVNLTKDHLDIIYEDENFLFVNKSKGILIHGDKTEKRKTLANEVLSYLYNKGEFDPKDNSFVPSPCHRLDRNTSGIVIFAKNFISSKEMMELLKTHENIHKSYLALLVGKTEEAGEIDAPLLKDAESGFVKVTNLKNGGKTAHTKYKRLDSIDGFSLVDAKLITGRTHQLRVHFAYINHPIIGDQKYGNFEKNKEFEKKFNYSYQFLHAYKIEFGNTSGALSYFNGKTFIAKMPKKDEEILKSLGFKNFNE